MDKFRKRVCIFEIFLLVSALVSFGYLVSGSVGEINPLRGLEFLDLIPSVSAQSLVTTGCCLETVDGATCQEINQADKDLCAEGYVAASCEQVAECKVGCCVNSEQGLCSLNSPVSLCEEGGGDWYDDASCGSVGECSLGCCVLGDQARASTTRECTLLSREYGFEKDFRELDEFGSCSAHVGLAEEGACLQDTGDFSGEKECSLTTKQECSGEFKAGFLCTAKALNTICTPTKETSCIEGKDEVYFLDSCGNRGNIYDSLRSEDESYWEKITSRESSCSGDARSCGSCDYLSGSICSKAEDSKVKPDFGNYICRDLGCDDQGMRREHGESWCVNDFVNQGQGADPTGSRHFRRSCVEGEITTEPCGDFNQEICLEASGEEGRFGQAACIVNDWRSCIAANEKETYDQIKNECESFDHCMMFSEEFTEYEELAGFKRNLENHLQGSAGGVGQDNNAVIAHCVPRYTPGGVFWAGADEEGSSAFNHPGLPEELKKENDQGNTGIDSGGSLEETAGICALGSFTCVTRQKKSGALSDWSWKENKECEIRVDEDETQRWLQGLNERCRMLGPCGSYVNIAGELGRHEGFSVERIKIDEEGKNKKIKADRYNLSGDYLSGLSGKPGLKSLGFSEGGDAGITGNIIFEVGAALVASGPIAGVGAASSAGAPATQGGLLGGLGKAGGAVWSAALAAAAAYGVGLLIGELAGLSKAETSSLSLGLASGVGSGLIAKSILSSKTLLGPGSFIAGLSAFIIGAVIAAVVYVVTFEEERHYITTFTCEPWGAPVKGQCDLCNDQEGIPCSEYRCRSLGENCEYYTGLGEPGYCASAGHVGAARISPWEEALTEGHEYANVGELQFEIVKNGGALEAFIPISFGIETDVAASCRIGLENSDEFGSLGIEMIASQESARTKHKISLSPHVGGINLNEDNSESADEEDPSGFGILPLQVGETNRYFIKCENFAGIVNDAAFVVEIEVSQGPDLTPPLITRFDPESGGFAAHKQNSSEIKVYVNEPAQCRWDRQSKNFDQMANSLACLTEPSLGFLGEWSCSGDLGGVKHGENDFFFSCQDLEGNSNRARLYSLEGCTQGLSVSRILPSEGLIFGGGSFEIDILLKTQGCVNQGEAICSFEIGDSGEVEMFETGGLEHRQKLDALESGKYDVKISCEDIAGNKAEDEFEINIEIDDRAPKITRVFDLNGNLVVVTDEEAECFVSNEGCEFSFSDGSLMESTGAGLTHATPFLSGESFVRCRDEFGNSAGRCQLAARPELVGLS